MQDGRSEKRTLREILDSLPILVNDIKIAGEKPDVKEKLDNEQYMRRSYIRTFLPMIEGVIYGIKMALFGIATTRNFKNVNSLNGPDLFILRGLTYELKENGKVYEKPKYFRTKGDLKFAVESFNRILGANINLNVGAQDWENFNMTIKIRNDIMHPKNSAELTISDKDWECISSVSSWFYNIFAEMLHALQEFSENQKLYGKSLGIPT